VYGVFLTWKKKEKPRILVEIETIISNHSFVRAGDYLNLHMPHDSVDKMIIYFTY